MAKPQITMMPCYEYEVDVERKAPKERHGWPFDYELLAGKAYPYAEKHPELCPPIGTVIRYRNKYGVVAIGTVRFVMNGLPGIERKPAPMEEQPPHLRDAELIAQHFKTAGMRLGWTMWPDNFYVEQLGRYVEYLEAKGGSNASNSDG